LAQLRPEELKLHRLTPPSRGEPNEDFERREIVNLVALAAVVALILVGYWVFNALGHSRGFQRCLDSGRSNCVDFVNPAK
jgi:hypothetical protein